MALLSIFTVVTAFATSRAGSIPAQGPLQVPTHGSVASLAHRSFTPVMGTAERQPVAPLKDGRGSASVFHMTKDMKDGWMSGWSEETKHPSNAAVPLTGTMSWEHQPMSPKSPMVMTQEFQDGWTSGWSEETKHPSVAAVPLAGTTSWEHQPMAPTSPMIMTKELQDGWMSGWAGGSMDAHHAPLPLMASATWERQAVAPKRPMVMTDAMKNGWMGGWTDAQAADAMETDGPMGHLVGLAEARPLRGLGWTASKPVSALETCPGAGTTCDIDGNRVCAQIFDDNGAPLQWGAGGNFWDVAGNQKWDKSNIYEIRKNKGDSWCIDMPLAANLIQNVGCKNVHFRCEATDTSFLMGASFTTKKHLSKLSQVELEALKSCFKRECAVTLSSVDSTRGFYVVIAMTALVVGALASMVFTGRFSRKLSAQPLLG